MLPLSHVGFTTAAVKVLEKGLRFPPIDYRVLIVASLLPDLIDKPLYSLLEGSYVYESRALGHSLVFLGCLGVLMVIQWFWKRELFLFTVFLGVLFHDILDVMWLHRGIFLWPLEGWQFPKATGEAWLGQLPLFGYNIRLLDFLDNISVLILLFFFMKIAWSGKIAGFLRKGKL